jgi:hypothetical protein
MVDSHERDCKPSDSIKDGKFLDQLSDYQLFKTNSAYGGNYYFTSYDQDTTLDLSIRYIYNFK